MNKAELKPYKGSAGRKKAAPKTTPNKRLCGKIAHPLGQPMLKAFAILPKFYSVSYGASGKRLRHRPRPVSCRLFPVTARKILLAGTSALRKTSHNLDVGCNIFGAKPKHVVDKY